MKNLSLNILIIVMLVWTMTSIQSCSDECPEKNQAEVTFMATLPVDVLSRSFGDAEQINTLVVGVFNSDYQELYRKACPISGTHVEGTFALAQNQTYHFVFWAYDNSQQIYCIDDLRAIRMNALPVSLTFSEAESSDAFYAIKENVTVEGDRKYMVELIRPLAQINVGTTGKVVQTSLTAKAVPDTFYPFNNQVNGKIDLTWNFSESTNEIFSVEDKTYHYLGMGYVFAPTTPTSIAVELTLTDVNAQVSETVDFLEVKIGANFKSNIVGNFTPKSNLN